MNIADIKTESEFYEMADIWYQRSHKIREIWQNPDETEIRKEKAFKIWLKLYYIVMGCSQIAIKISQPKPFQYKKGSK